MRIDPEQRLAELDRLPVLDQDLGDDAGAAGLDVVEDLHRLDDADDRRRRDAEPTLTKGGLGLASA